MKQPVIALFAGATSPEREVSLGSGKAAALAMAYTHPTQFFTIESDALPEGLDPAKHIVCSTLHGVFGEDGGMQRHLAGEQIEGDGSQHGEHSPCDENPSSRRHRPKIARAHPVSVQAGPRARRVMPQRGQYSQNSQRHALMRWRRWVRCRVTDSSWGYSLALHLLTASRPRG